MTIGSPGYEPPEVLREQTYSRKSDVYSFGIFLAALIFLQSPGRDTRFKIPKSFSEEKRSFLFPFWSKEPKDRPDIKVATEILKMEKLFAIK